MMPVQTRNELVGVLWMAYSIIFVFAGVLMGGMFVGMGGLIALLPPPEGQGEPPPWWFGGLMGGMGLVFGAAFVGVGLLGVVAGWYTRKGRTWAKIVLAFLAFTQLTQFPVGSLVGIVTWVLLFLPEPPAGGAGAGGAPPTPTPPPPGAGPGAA